MASKLSSVSIGQSTILKSCNFFFFVPNTLQNAASVRLGREERVREVSVREDMAPKKLAFVPMLEQFFIVRSFNECRVAVRFGGGGVGIGVSWWKGGGRWRSDSRFVAHLY